MSGMSRRSFVGTVGAVAVGACAPGRVWGRQDKIVLEAGPNKYEWVSGWLKLPSNVSLSSTHGCVAVDSQDRIFFNTENENAVIIVDNDGNYVKSFGKDFKGGAHGMTIVKEGDKEVLWLSSLSRSEILKCSLDGEVLLAIPYPEKSGVYSKKQEYKPTSVAVAPNGDVYVGDGYGKSWCHRFNAKGEYVQSWNEGKGGKLNQPHGIQIDTRGAEPIVAVADRGNSQIQTFTLDGKPIAAHKEGLRRPCKVYVRGELTLIPDLQGRITLLDKDYKLIAHLGENEDPKKQGNFGVKEFKDGQFTAPHGAAIDSKGNLYVEDWNTLGRVNKLRKV